MLRSGCGENRAHRHHQWQARAHHCLPAGIKALADYLRDRGLLLGIYGDSGEPVCAPHSKPCLALLPGPVVAWKGTASNIQQYCSVAALALVPLHSPLCRAFVAQSVRMQSQSFLVQLPKLQVTSLAKASLGRAATRQRMHRHLPIGVGRPCRALPPAHRAVWLRYFPCNHLFGVHPQESRSSSWTTASHMGTCLRGLWPCGMRSTPPASTLSTACASG